MQELTRKLYAVAVALLLLGQGVLALTWFGPAEDRLTNLLSDEPILSGRHPLHLYHADLGVSSFLETGSTSCYDPSFQAGYPKTPVFDGGCRPAEFVLLFAKLFGVATERAYKLSLFLLALLVPVAFALAAWGIQLKPSGQIAAGLLGCLVWWAGPVQAMLAAGSVDLLLAGLAGLVYVGGLARYSGEPGPTAWCLAAGASVVGWYAQPVFWLGMVLIGLGHYLVAAPKHGLIWQLGRGGITAAGVLPNLWWLLDWLKYWWLCTPSIDDFTNLPRAVSVLGHLADYPALLGWNAAGWTISALGVPGAAVLIRAGKGAATLGLLSTAILAIVLAKYATAAPTLQLLHAERAVWFAVALLTLPAAGLLSLWWQQSRAEALLALPASSLVLVFSFTGNLNVKPLVVGLSFEQRELIQILQEKTTKDGRILWEDPEQTRASWNWSVLLPRYVDRSFLGGLDAGACVDHGFLGLRYGRLNGRAFADWTEHARQEFLERYNIRWVLTRTAPAATWWAANPNTHEVARLQHDKETLVLFRIDRKPSFFLSGRGVVEQADRRKIVLTNVVPDDQNEVVLSFHFQPGLRIAPLFIYSEPVKDADDPVPLLKLKLSGPTSRVVLVWEP